MVDLDILRKRGIHDEALRAKLSSNPLTWKADGDEGLRLQMHNRHRSRIQEAMNRNFQDYRIYHALDTAWDTPFRQISPTLLGDFLEKDPNDEEVNSKIKEWGLTHMITQEVDQRTGKETGKKSFNLPMFFEVFVPLVKAYVTIRWAKIMNDRRLTPFFKYDPAKVTAINKLKCGVITDRVQVMSNQYGYYDVTKQAVLKMLHYSSCLQFVKEEWDQEEQLKYADETDVALKRLTEEGKECVVGDEIWHTTKEGIRYHLPHPTRFFSDLNHGNWTYNYDCGSEFAGYWNIRRYRDILNAGLWNGDAISIGPNSLVQDHRTFFASVYSACTLLMPVSSTKTNDGNTLLAQTGGGIGDLDKEKQLAYLYYGTDHLDQGVLVTEYFEKLNPKQNGLGDYDADVWFRFVVAGDNTTYMYATPLPYCPIVYYGYDADESRTNNASLSLECLPFQDHFGNTLSQILLTAKQNLANMTLVDTDILEPEAIKKMQGLGEQYFRFLNIFGFSGKKMQRLQARTMEAIQGHSLPKGNIAELTNVLNTILDVLERVLVMSSHEVAQAASHEQTREEVRNIAQSTSTRLLFTATPVDIAREAWKRQLYQGVMAYGDDDVYAHVPSDVPLTKEVITKLGFTFVDEDEHTTASDNHRAVRVDKKRTAIDLWTLASTRDGEDRANDSQMAQVMAMMARDLMANPITAQAIGPDQAIQIANQIAQLAGLPRDFILRNVNPQAGPEQAQAQAQQQLQQVVQIVLQQVNQNLQNELKPLLDHTMANSKDIALIIKAMGINVPNPATAGDTSQPQPPPG